MLLKNATIFLVIIGMALLTSCDFTHTNQNAYPLESEDSFLNTTIHLEADTTRIILQDYVSNPSKIDSIIMPKGLSVQRFDNDQQLLLTASSELQALSLLRLKYGGVEWCIPVKKSKKQNVTFIFDPGEALYNTVQLVGDMNAWNPNNTPLEFKNKKWITHLSLLSGIYPYKMVLDGTWQLDKNNPDTIENGIGGWNSKLVVENENDSIALKLFTHSFNNQKILIGSSQEVQGIIALWQNEAIPISKHNNYYQLEVPAKAKQVKRSFVRVSAFYSDEVSNELLIPLEFGVPVKDPAQLNRFDKATNITYFLLVDRFCNGTPDNDAPLNISEVLPKADFYGGDIEGVLKKMRNGYFDSLGMNTIWLSPIVQNPEGAYGLFDKGGVKTKFSAYHGYWPISFTKIDTRFGSETAFHTLIREAHDRDMNVFIDFVANHVHEEHAFYKMNKDKAWTTELYLPDGSLNTERWDDYRLTTWFDVFLPTLNLEIQEVTEILSDSALYWVTHYDIDGFRHDAAKHIPNNFWRTLTKKIKKYSIDSNKQVTQIGETYGTPELINSYINTGMLDGQFDFNVFDALLFSLCKEEYGLDYLEEKLEQSFDYYGVNNLMGYISGNQDRPRFMALATGDVRFDEDSKLAGWQRDIQLKTAEGYAKLKLLNTIILTIPGIPVLYYGDEIGLTGGNDPDCRRMMRFDQLDARALKLRSAVSTVAHFRRNNLAFLYGDFTFLQANAKTMVYARKYFDQLGIVFINNSAEEKTLRIPTPVNYDLKGVKSLFKGDSEIRDGFISVTLPPFSTQIIYR